MPFVVDASVALAWFFPDEHAEYATMVILRMKTESASAPNVWPYEIANAILTAERRSRLNASETTRIADEATRLPVIVHQPSTAHIFGGIVELARQQRLTAYDAAYLDLAMREGLQLATLDDDLRAAAERVGVALVA